MNFIFKDTKTQGWILKTLRKTINKKHQVFRQSDVKYMKSKRFRSSNFSACKKKFKWTTSIDVTTISLIFYIHPKFTIS